MILRGFYTYSPWGPELSWEGNESSLHASIQRIRKTEVVVRNRLLEMASKINRYPRAVTVVKLSQGQLIVPFSLKTTYPTLKNNSYVIQLLPVSFSTEKFERIGVYLWKGGYKQGPPRYLLCPEKTDNIPTESFRFYFSIPNIVEDMNYRNFPKLIYSYQNNPWRTLFDLKHSKKDTQPTRSLLVKAVVPCQQIYSLLRST